MTLDEMHRKVLAILPDSSIGEDNDGQIVIYTDLTESANGGLVSFVVPNS